MTERDPAMTMPPDAPLTPTPTPSPTPTSPPPPVAPAPAVPPVPAGKPSGSGRWLNVLLAVAAVIAVGGVAFAIGRSTAPASAATFPGGMVVNGGPLGSFDPGSLPQGGPGGPGFLGAGGPTIEGTVTAVDADSITIRLPSGNEVTLAIDGDTTYHESTPADASVVAVGDEVSVQAVGGRVVIGGDGPSQGQAGGPSVGDDLTAGDITVRR